MYPQNTKCIVDGALVDTNFNVRESVRFRLLIKVRLSTWESEPMIGYRQNRFGRKEIVSGYIEHNRALFSFWWSKVLGSGKSYTWPDMFISNKDLNNMWFNYQITYKLFNILEDEYSEIIEKQNYWQWLIFLIYVLFILVQIGNIRQGFVHLSVKGSWELSNMPALMVLGKLKGEIEQNL